MLIAASKNKIINFLTNFQFFCLSLALFFIPMSEQIFEVFLVWGFVCFVAIILLNKDFSVFKDKAIFFLAIFFISGCLSLLNSNFLDVSLRWVFKKLIESIFIFIIFKEAIRRGFKTSWVFLILLVSALMVSIDAIYQFIIGVDFLALNSQMKGLTACFSYSNDFGAYLLIPIFLIISKVISDNLRSKTKLLYFLFLLSSCLFLLLTFSRGAWFGLFISLLVLAYYKRKQKVSKIILISLFSAIFLLLIFILFFSSKFFPGNSMFSYCCSSSARVQLWKTAFSYFKSHPMFGMGIGTFIYQLWKAGFEPHYLHNCFFQILVEQGVIGFFAFTAFVYIMLKDCLNSLKNNRDILFLGLFFGMIAFLVHMFFDNHLYLTRLSFLFWAAMGILRGFSLKSKA